MVLEPEFPLPIHAEINKKSGYAHTFAQRVLTHFSYRISQFLTVCIQFSMSSVEQLMGFMASHIGGVSKLESAQIERGGQGTLAKRG